MASSYEMFLVAYKTMRELLPSSDEMFLEACRHGSEQTMRKLITAGRDPRNVKYDDGHTPLHLACQWGHLGIVKLLVETHGYEPYNVRCCPSSGNLDTPQHPAATPLLEAFREEKWTIFRYLISDCHCNVNVCDDEGNTALHLACRDGHLDILKFLMSEHPPLPPCRVPDPERKNKNRMTPLLLACRNMRWDVVNYLISECHCDASVSDGGGYTPLHHACIWGHLETIRLLTTQLNCDVNATNWLGDTPLHSACAEGHIDVVRFLMSMRTEQTLLPPYHVPDFERRNRDNMTPLLLACQYERWSVVQCLLSECHCDVKAANNLGDTPLHMICRKNNFEIAKLLLQHGSSPIQRNKAGKSSLDIADNVLLIQELLCYVMLPLESTKSKCCCILF